MLKPKSLNFEVDTADLSMNDIQSLYNIFFHAKDYDWWYEVLPGDYVVDIGAGIGMFSAKALDAGAARVFMIEPCRDLLKTAVKNVSDHIIDHQDTPTVIPINAAIGKTDIDLSNIYGGDDNVKLMGLMELCETYGIAEIDFLKISAAGAEYSVLSDNMDWLATHVRHTAVRCHLDAQYGGTRKFKEWRDSFLKPMTDLGRVFYKDNTYYEKVASDDFNDLLPRSFMVYIKNW